MERHTVDYGYSVTNEVYDVDVVLEITLLYEKTNIENDFPWEVDQIKFKEISIHPSLDINDVRQLGDLIDLFITEVNRNIDYILNECIDLVIRREGEM